MPQSRTNRKLAAYITGLALGDGNLSNPNGRAIRLRITCDTKYPQLIKHIKQCLEKFLPQNKVSTIPKKGRALDISCYSNKWENVLGWKACSGSKQVQKVSIPKWIHTRKFYIRECLRGLFQTDGSIYKDRGYLMVNLVSEIPTLAGAAVMLIEKLGYEPNTQILEYRNGKKKHTIRIAKYAEKFIQDIQLWKK